MTLPWFRFYHEFAGDPVVQCLAFEDQRHFVMVLCLKASGFLDREWPSEEIRHRMVCHALGLDPASGAEAKRRLMEVAVIGTDWHPANWDKRQFQSDNASERVRNWRARNRETLQQRNSYVPVTPQDTDTDTDTDSETEGRGDARGEKSSRKRSDPAPKAKRLSADWKPDDGLRAYAEAELPNVDVDRLAEDFRDYWIAKPGEKGRKLDWPATWRTWVRRSADRYPVKPTARKVPERQIRYDANGREISV